MTTLALVPKRRRKLDPRRLKTRDALTLQYLDIIPGIVRTMRSNLPPSFGTDDLEQAGAIGLMKAAKRYDPRRNDCFEAWARPYIRNEILMSVRRREWRNSTHEPLCRRDGGGTGKLHLSAPGPEVLYKHEPQALLEMRDPLQAKSLARAVDRLPERCAKVIQMAYSEREPRLDARAAKVHGEAIEMLRRDRTLAAELGMKRAA